MPMKIEITHHKYIDAGSLVSLDRGGTQDAILIAVILGFLPPTLPELNSGSECGGAFRTLEDCACP